MTQNHSIFAPDSAAMRSYRDGGMLVFRYQVSLDQIPADFYADPDGTWTYEELCSAAGFAEESGVAVGALRETFNGHPDGCAVVTLNASSRPYVAIIECPIAYRPVQADDRQASAA